MKILFLLLFCIVFVTPFSIHQEFPAEIDFNLYDRNLTRITRQSVCNGFRCKSGECISEDSECDGISNCKDGSDETSLCQSIPCPAYLFRCKYGACINAEYECDGKQDCRDNSDETCKKISSKDCTAEQFQCASGECISEDYKCDGTAHCQDASDETKETCSTFRCPGYTYRCDYGACVSGNSKCNGQKECLDGSDEKSCVAPVIPTPPPSKPLPPPDPEAPEGSCVLPEHPPHGRWDVFGNRNLQPGTSVPNGSILQITCNKNYILDGQKTILCYNRFWNAHMPVCLALCSEVTGTSHMTVKCTYKDHDVDCHTPLSGTKAVYQCDDYYEISRSVRKLDRYCFDGTWDKPKPKCEPECGKKSVTGQKLIVNGENANRTEYPWQAALYNSKQVLICGGSLITPRAILSAAHCVTDANGDVYPKERFKVAIGKYFRDMNDKRDNDAQFSEVEKIFVHENYRGDIQNFQADIALIVTTVTFQLRKYVLPVCVDWSMNYETQFMNPDPDVSNATLYGYVTGWGFTKESSNVSETLKELRLPFINYNKCSQELPVDYEYYLTPDKLCAGYLNQGKSVCKGDSGGGLVVKNGVDGRYYVVGVVSLSPAPTQGNGCNAQQYGLFTKVSKYVSYFTRSLLKYTTSN